MAAAAGWRSASAASHRRARQLIISLAASASRIAGGAASGVGVGAAKQRQTRGSAWLGGVINIAALAAALISGAAAHHRRSGARQRNRSSAHLHLGGSGASCLAAAQLGWRQHNVSAALGVSAAVIIARRRIFSAWRSAHHQRGGVNVNNQPRGENGIFGGVASAASARRIARRRGGASSHLAHLISSLA